MKQRFIQIAIATSLLFSPMAWAQEKNLAISGLNSNVTERQIQIGETLKVEVNGTPGARASVLLVGDKQQVREYQAKEVSPGVYIAQVILGSRDRITEGIILARMQLGSQVVYRSLDKPFAVLPSSQGNVPRSSQTVDLPTVSSSNVPLTFTSHQNRQQISSDIVLEGQTEPNAEVQIAVTTSKTLIEGLATIQGNTQINRVVQADDTGKFQVQIPIEKNAPEGLRYEITATARTKTSQTRTGSLTLIQK